MNFGELFELLLLATIGGGVAVFCLRLLARGRIAWLLGVVFAAVLFSGYRDPRVGSLFEALRFFCVGLVAVSGLVRFRRTGTTMRLLFFMSLWLLALAPRSPSATGGVFFAGAMVLATGPFASGVSRVTSSPAALVSLLHLLIRLSPIYIALAVLGLGGRLQNQRFSGSTTSPQLFAITGGLLVPLLLWGFFYGSRRIRPFSAAALALVTVFTLLSAQRAGLVAAFLGVVPFFIIGPLRTYWRTVAVAAAGVAGLAVLRGASAFEYSFLRFGNLDNTARTERWQEGFRQVMSDPLLGHGPASLGQLDFGLHNSFLAVAYEGGLVSFALWTAAIVVLAYRASMLLRIRVARESGIALLLFGWTLGVLSVALVEVKAYSPSNLVMLLIVLIATASRRGVFARFTPATAEPALASPPVSIRTT